MLCMQVIEFLHNFFFFFNFGSQVKIWWLGCGVILNQTFPGTSFPEFDFSVCKLEECLYSSYKIQ